MQRFQALQQQKGIERAESRAYVTQQLHAGFENESHVAHAGKLQRYPVL
jgi:hypothetical protein